MRFALLLLAGCAPWSAAARAQDVSSGIAQSWTSTQSALNAEGRAWAAPECVREGRWAVTCDGRPVAPQASQADRLRFTPSIQVRRRNFARFVEKTRAVDPAGAAQLQAALADGDLIQSIAEKVTPFGLRTDDVADAMALYVMEAWEAVTGRVLPPSRARAQAVKRQMEQAAAGLPALAQATDADKQEFAEALLVQAALVGATAEAARGGDAGRMRVVADAVAAGAKATTGLDLRTLTLSDAGFALEGSEAAAGAAAPPARTADASVSAAAADAALRAALAAVPPEARPVDVVLNGVGSHVGWPPSYVYTVTTFLLFGNGWATTCADWDPARFRPTPASLGAAYPDCGLRRWRRDGAGVRLQNEDGSWFAPTGVAGELRAFKPGETLDIAFGNLGGIGFAGAPGAVSTSVLSGSDLRMTSAGEIAVGDWSSAVISGADVGGGSSRRSGGAAGRYRLDGNLIAIRDASGDVRVGFITGTPAKGPPEHVYLNGKQFWKNDD